MLLKAKMDPTTVGYGGFNGTDIIMGDTNNFTEGEIILDHNTYHSFSSLHEVQRILDTIITPIVCCCGCIGNIINLLVLSRIRQRMRKAEGGRDNGTHLGLIILAVSDMLFCVTFFPRCFLSTSKSLFELKSFFLYYQVYGTGFVTTFILTSTWLMVTMAFMRYLGICHPFCARKMDGPTSARVIYALVFVLCLTLNLPSFWQYKIIDLPIDGQLFYLIDIGYFDLGETSGKVFLWAKAVLGIFLPALILLFCNTSLILALRKSYRLRRQCHVPEQQSNTSNRITLTLIIIIIMFVLLGFPTEIMDFVSSQQDMGAKETEFFITIRTFANLLQVISFSFNFVLYCVINVHYRRILYEIGIKICNFCLRKKQHHIIRRDLSSRTSVTYLTQNGTIKDRYEASKLPKDKEADTFL